jgi:hypothetical protein
MKRDAVLEKIAPIVEGKVRDIDNSFGARVVVTPDMVQLRPRRGAQTIEAAKEPLMNFAGLPLHLAKALSPNTQSLILSELLEKAGSYSMVVKDDKVTAMVPFGSKHPVDPEHLLSLVEKTIPVSDYLRVMLEGQFATVELVGETQTEVVKGDLVKAGVMMGFSPMGVKAPWVQSYAERLVCSNGMTHNEILAEFTGGGGGGNGDNIWNFFRSSVRKAYNSFDKVVTGWRALVEEQIPPEQRGPMLLDLIKKSQLPPKVAAAIQSMALKSPPTNSWEMQNLISFATTHLMDKATPKQITKALKVVADFGAESTHDLTCPLCNRHN